LGDPLSTRHPTSATDIFDDNLLFENLTQPGCHNSADDIGRAASREWHNHSDRAGRPVFGVREPYRGSEQAPCHRHDPSFLHTPLLTYPGDHNTLAATK
jgi:hypothetical protein